MEQITDAASAVAYTQYVQSALNVVMTLHATSYMWMPESYVPDEAVYDYIVVGAGTAGTIVASRLAQNKTVKVLLIEAGGDPPLESVLPGLVQYTKSSQIDYNFTTMDDGYSQQCHQGQNYMLHAGKVLGGTSSVNLMLYERGNKRDYDSWATAAKDQSWTLTNTLKYFKYTENLEDPTILNSQFKVFHGVDGPLTVTKENSSEVNKYLEAFTELGNRIVLDLNSNVNIGYAKTQYTVGNIRQSTASAFLKASDKSPYLDLLKNTEVTKVLFDSNNNAIGVLATKKDNKIITVRARKEVIISAGVINTPKLLMLSGIGPKKHLECNNIKVKADLPVGRNFHDHLAVVLIYTLGQACNRTRKVDLRKFPFPSITGYVALNKSSHYPDYIASGYFLLGKLAAEQALQDNAFFDRYSYDICNRIYEQAKGNKLLFSFVKNTNVKSRGTVLLRSTNPEDQPIILPGLYSYAQDLENHVDYVLDYLKVQNTNVFKTIGAELIDPVKQRCGKYKFGSREYWKCYILCMMGPSGHAVGTCALGSVVNSKLMVFGVKRLRVVDASIIPVVTSGGTYAPTMMIGEKAADMILEDLHS